MLFNICLEDVSASMATLMLPRLSGAGAGVGVATSGETPDLTSHNKQASSAVSDGAQTMSEQALKQRIQLNRLEHTEHIDGNGHVLEVAHICRHPDTNQTQLKYLRDVVTAIHISLYGSKTSTPLSLAVAIYQRYHRSGPTIRQVRSRNAAAGGPERGPS